MGHMGSKRRTGASDDEVIAAYAVSKSAATVERELGVCQSTIYRILKRADIERVGLREYRKRASKFKIKQSNAIRECYEGGMSFEQLTSKFGGTSYSIKTAIIRAGGKLVPVCPPMSDKEVATILRLYGDGVSQMDISIKLKRSQGAIGRVLRKNGVVCSARYGPTSTQWKGGRWADGNGYIKVWVDKNDALRSMRDRCGYVLEHRLVMARHLGRPLTKYETVHHINGRREDNRIENLQLRNGRHGNGAAFQCLDCGSHNIQAVRLRTAAAER